MTTRLKLPPEHKLIHDLSERIVAAQQPIRILDSLKWDERIKARFFHDKCQKLPKVDADYYQKRPLPYSPDDKKTEFYGIERDVKRQLGQFSDIGNIMLRMCREYRTVISLLENRGKPEFGKISQELYGSAEDVFYASGPSIRDLALTLSEVLHSIGHVTATAKDEKIYSSHQAVKELQQRFNNYFNDPQQRVKVKISDGIMADAAAGAETLKLRENAQFSERDLRVLEVHEGWVHMGTTINGMLQPICTFLSKGPPSSTITQEGLAVIMEIFTFSSFPARVLRLTNRVNAIYLVEEGANFLDVYKFYLESGLTPDESYNNTTRAFRGSTPEGLPFTKDLAYSKGFISIYNYVRLAIRFGLLERIPLLFLGKTSLEDIHIFEQLLKEKIIVPPRYIPAQFADIAALSAWMCYSLFLNKFSLDRLSQDYMKFL